MSSFAEQVQRVCSKIESGDASEWEDLKLELHKLTIISVIDEDAPLTPDQEAQAKLAIKALEAIIFFAVKQNSIDLFESNITFLLSLYSLDSSSAHRIEIFSLYLAYLLEKDNIAEFHIELEKVPLELQSTDIYLSFIVRLEQAFMEGCFVTFRKLCDSALSDDKFAHFFVFLRVLVEKARVRVAECCECAFARGTLRADALRADYLGVRDDVFANICKERNWVICPDGTIDFCPTADIIESKNTRNESLQLLKIATDLANGLDQLV